MSDDEDEEGWVKFGAPKHRGNDLAMWFMYHALKQIRGGNLSTFRQVLRDTKTIHDNFMESPAIGLCIFRCIKSSSKDVILCLMEEGLNPNLLFQGRTMLHEAVKISNKHMLLFLLSLPGIDKNAYNSKSKTPLMDAAMGRPECLKILLEAGCNINLMDNLKNKALHQVFRDPNGHRNDIIACLDLLRDHGVDINEIGAFDKTCLQRAIESSTPWLFGWLIHNNCDLNVQVHSLRLNPVHFSAVVLSVPEVTTPFRLACHLKNRVFVEVLVSSGCRFRQDRWVLENTRSVCNLHQSLTQAFNRVDSLQQCCRRVLRNCLTTDIVAESQRLGLPDPLRCFLLCHGELQTLQGWGECSSCKWRTKIQGD